MLSFQFFNFKLQSSLSNFLRCFGLLWIDQPATNVRTNGTTFISTIVVLMTKNIIIIATYIMTAISINIINASTIMIVTMIFIMEAILDIAVVMILWFMSSCRCRVCWAKCWHSRRSCLLLHVMTAEDDPERVACISI